MKRLALLLILALFTNCVTTSSENEQEKSAENIVTPVDTPKATDSEQSADTEQTADAKQTDDTPTADADTKQTDDTEEPENTPQTTDTEQTDETEDDKIYTAGVVFSIELKDRSGSSKPKVQRQFYSAPFQNIRTRSSSYGDFSVIGAKELEKSRLSVLNFDNRGHVFNESGKVITKGCYKFTIVSVAHPQYYSLHVISKLSRGRSYKTPDLDFDIFFQGEFCVNRGILTSVSNPKINKQQYSIDKFSKYLITLGISPIENPENDSLDLAAVGSSVKIPISGRQFNVIGRDFSVSKKLFTIKLEGGRNHSFYIPASTKIEDWLRVGDNAQNLRKSINSNIFSTSAPNFRNDGTNQSLGGRSPSKNAARIYSSYSRNFALAEERFVGTSETNILADSNNIIEFGKIKGLPGSFVLSKVRDPSRLKPEKKLDYRKESKIMKILGYRNVKGELKNKYTRTMIPQPLSISADGTSSINQMLIPLKPVHMEIGGFNLAGLKEQLFTMAETVEFLHAPVKLQGRFYAVSHRNIKPENFLQQSQFDSRAAITDFDLSEVISAKSLEEFNKRIRVPFTTRVAGTPKTIDPNLLRATKQKRSVTFKELMASDIWSLGISMLELTFGYRMFFENILGATKPKQIYRIYEKDGAVASKIEDYFTDKSDPEILNENPNLSVEQIRGMRMFIDSDTYKIIDQKMLKLDPFLRANAADITYAFYQ